MVPRVPGNRIGGGTHAWERHADDSQETPKLEKGPLSGAARILGAMTKAPGTVLVVEDEESIADVLAIALRYHRFEVMTAGTVFLMWLGEQIDEYGIGNGISLLIMAGIVAQMPAVGAQFLTPAFKNGQFDVSLGSEVGIDRLILLAALFVAVILGVIAITQATRRIPIQSAKHVRGRRVMGGQRSYLPMRLNADALEDFVVLVDPDGQRVVAVVERLHHHQP